MKCKACNSDIDPIDVFPGGICVECYEVKFDADVKRNGGKLPKPDFTKAITELN